MNTHRSASTVRQYRFPTPSGSRHRSRSRTASSEMNTNTHHTHTLDQPQCDDRLSTSFNICGRLELTQAHRVNIKFFTEQLAQSLQVKVEDIVIDTVVPGDLQIDFTLLNAPQYIRSSQELCTYLSKDAELHTKLTSLHHTGQSYYSLNTASVPQSESEYLESLELGLLFNKMTQHVLEVRPRKHDLVPYLLDNLARLHSNRQREQTYANKSDVQHMTKCAYESLREDYYALQNELTSVKQRLNEQSQEMTKSALDYERKHSHMNTLYAKLAVENEQSKKDRESALHSMQEAQTMLQAEQQKVNQLRLDLNHYKELNARCARSATLCTLNDICDNSNSNSKQHNSVQREPLLERVHVNIPMHTERPQQWTVISVNERKR